MLRPSLTLVAFLSVTQAFAQTRTSDVIYMRSGGAAFTMDVVRPQKPNGAGVVVIVSGGWMSDHAMLNSLAAAFEAPLLGAGFTVFEVIHGARPRYRIQEIVDQVREAVRFVHMRGADYRVDPNRIGVTGFSSGGHLSLMAAAGRSTSVRSVAAIAPPTDFANWGKSGALITNEPTRANLRPAMGLNATTPKRDAEVVLKKLSPVSLVNPTYPSTLIVHGNNDKVIPLQQGRSLVGSLSRSGVLHRFVIVPGGGHDEKTFVPGVTEAVRWFRDTLLK